MPKSQARWDGRARWLLDQAAAEGGISRRVRPHASIALDWDTASRLPPATVGGAVRFARLIQRRGRAFGPAFGRRRLRRPSELALVATRGDTASHRPHMVRLADLGPVLALH